MKHVFYVYICMGLGWSNYQLKAEVRTVALPFFSHYINAHTMQEIWKDIPGYEQVYQISDLGRLRSFKYGCWNILNPGVDTSGYRRSCLRLNRKCKRYRVHQLIAMAFLGHKPDGTFKIVVDHYDGDKLNNSLTNIKLITNRENTSKDKKPKSGYTGVIKTINKIKPWRASIQINGKRKHIGNFKTPELAYEAYKKELF